MAPSLSPVTVKVVPDVSEWPQEMIDALSERIAQRVAEILRDVA